MNTPPRRDPNINVLLGGLGGLAAFALVALIGILIWIFAISPGRGSASAGESADVSLAITDAPDPVVRGERLTYTLTVHNDGPDSASGVSVSEPVPVGTRLESASTTTGSCSGRTSVACDLGSLDDGKTTQVRVVVTVTGTGTLSNAAEVSAATPDPDSSNNPATASTAVQGGRGEADLAVEATVDPQSARVGERLTYTVKVSNRGPASAPDVAVVERPAKETSVVSLGATQGQCRRLKSGEVGCVLGALGSGAEATMTVVVKAETEGEAVAVVVAGSKARDPDESNNAVKVTSTTTAGAGNGGAHINVDFCRRVSGNVRQCIEPFSYNPSSGVTRIRVSAAWAIWFRIANATSGDRMKIHYVDAFTRQEVLHDDKPATLVDGLNFRAITFRPYLYNAGLRFEVVVFYNDRRLRFDPPLRIEMTR